MDQLKQHEVTLRAEHVVLRPMTEDDWNLVHKWWNDPDVSYYADANDDEYSLEQLRDIVRMVLVPAAMALLGNANWYLPSWLEWLPEIRVEVEQVDPGTVTAD